MASQKIRQKDVEHLPQHERYRLPEIILVGPAEGRPAKAFVAGLPEKVGGGFPISAPLFYSIMAAVSVERERQAASVGDGSSRN